MRSTTYKTLTITALGHDGFLVRETNGELVFAFDPFEISLPTTATGEPILADIVFITHPHFDHCDPASIRKLLKPTGKVIAPVSCHKELASFGEQLELVHDEQKHQQGLLTYWVIPAYNVNKFRSPGEVFHPRQLGGVGIVVEVAGLRVYHAGDTDIVPEMQLLRKIDVAFLPISGRFVMTGEEAIEAARLIKPKLVIPMHFGKVLGTVTDAIKFQQQLRAEIPITVLTAE